MNVDCLRCFIVKEAERDMELRGRPSTVGFCLNVEQESRSMLKIRVELGLKECSKRFRLMALVPGKMEWLGTH